MKKTISIILSVVMLLSIVSVPSFATETATVYIDYDFKNYTGAHSEIQAAAQAGATVTFNPNTVAGTTIDDYAIDGDTGLRMVEDITGTRWFYVSLPSAITSGKVYLSFDVARMNHVPSSGKNAFICVGNSAVAATDDNIALRLNGAGIDSYDTDTTKKLEMTHSETTTTITHIDQIYELSNNGTTVDVDTYINGSLAGEKTLTVASFSVINFQLTATISYLDNLRIATMADNSFEASVSGTITDDADYIDVKFTEGILTSSVLPENIVLKDSENNNVTVDKVEKYRGRTLRIYPAEKLESGHYSLNVAGIERIRKDTDAAVKYSGNISFNVINGLLYFNDMENTTDGKMNGAYSPGLLTSYYGPEGYTALETGSGNSYIVPQKNNDGERMQMTLNNPISNGVLNIRFDVKVDTAENGVPFRLQARKTGDNTFMNLLAIDGGKIMTMAAQAYNVWGFGGAAYTCTSDTKYTVDVIYNLNNGAIDVYVDGVILQSKPAKAADAGEVNRIHFQLSKDVTYLDNVSISYMTKDSYCADINPVIDGANILNFRMRESAKPDTFNAEDISLTDSDGNAVEFNSVTITGNTDTFVKIETKTPLSKEKKYTVAFGDAVSIAGTSAKSLTITPVELFELVEFSVTDAEGNLIPDIKQLENGTNVNVNVVVKNNGTDAKPAKLLIGAYSNKDTVLENVGALDDWILNALDETSGSVEFEITSPMSVNIYAFVWSDLTSCQPIITKIPIN